MKIISDFYRVSGLGSVWGFYVSRAGSHERSA